MEGQTRYKSRLLSIWNIMYSSARPRDISDAAFNLLMLLADMYRAEHAGAYVTVDRLAELLKKSAKQIRNLINNLENANYVRVYEDRRNHYASIYVVPPLPGEDVARMPASVVIPDGETINQYWTIRVPAIHKNGGQTEEKRNKAAQQKFVSELKARDRRVKRATPPRLVGSKRK